MPRFPGRKQRLAAQSQKNTIKSKKTAIFTEKLFQGRDNGRFSVYSVSLENRFSPQQIFGGSSSLLFNIFSPRETPPPPSFQIASTTESKTMPLPNAYSLKISSIPLYFQAILQTEIPDRFDAGFLSGIGFRYAIDRSFIDILKELHFLSDSGMPTKRYLEFHSLVDAREILLDGIHEAYSKLFSLHPDAAALPEPQVVDALKRLYEGKKTDMMLSGIASTFLALCRFADNLDAVAAAVQQSRDAAESARRQHASPPAQTPPPPEAAAEQDTAPPHQPDATTASEPEPLLLGPEFEITTEAAPASEPGRETPSTTQAAPPPAATPEPLVLELEPEADVARPAPVAATAPQGGDDAMHAAPVFSDAAAPLPLVLELEPEVSAAAPPAAAPEPMPPLVLEEEGNSDTAPAMAEPVAAQAAPEPELPVLKLETPLATAQPEAPVPTAADTPAPMSESLTPVFEIPAPEAADAGGDATSPIMATTQDAMQDAAPADAPEQQQADATTPRPDATPDAAQAAPHVAAAAAGRQRERTGIPPSLVFDLDALPLKETPPENDAKAAPRDVACGTGEGVAKSMRSPIQIVLPESTDAAVYDAIFASLKRHLFTPGE
jgi:hypothetical protein